jgi:FlaA1/EpsC-like NDP-sugar epimerase
MMAQPCRNNTTEDHQLDPGTFRPRSGQQRERKKRRDRPDTLTSPRTLANTRVSFLAAPRRPTARPLSFPVAIKPVLSLLSRPMQFISRKTQLLLDCTFMAMALTLAYLLRFDFVLPLSVMQRWPAQVAFVIGLQTLLLRLVQAHQINWRSISLYDLPAFVIPMSLTALILALLRIFMPSRFALVMPFSVIFMNGMMGLGFLVGIRTLRRLSAEHTRNDLASTSRTRKVLLAGAGAAGSLALRELRQNSGACLDVVGFVDDDPGKYNTSMYGKKVLGTTSDIPALAEQHKIEEVIITIARASREAITSIVKICETARIKVRIIPSFSEIMEGRRHISALRNVDIEDVLGREPVNLEDADVQRFIRRKTIMITGAGGSIGSEIVRQIAHYHPSSLVLVERNELAMYNLDQELRNIPNMPPWRAVVADCGDMPRMRLLLEKHAIKLLVHAAAYKHVPLMEDNCCEALRNNTLATFHLAKLAAEMHVDAFVLISTDKAVNPTSVMGSTKRAAELCIQHLARNHTGTRFVAVRFGNVLGSSGSVIPLFRRQIAEGGPVTVTHPDMTRYFMTIPEAVSLVLRSATLGHSGEIMLLDMDEPIRIEELARRMIELSGLIPDKDIQIEYTGLRPGEKLFEELSTSEENAVPTLHPKIFVGKIQDIAGVPVPDFIPECEKILANLPQGSIHDLLQRMIPEANLGLSKRLYAESCSA